MSKIWFITGAARGFGRLWAEGALGRGDRVAASVRNPESLADLLDAYGDRVLPLRVDVTDRDAVFEAVATAHGHFGRLGHRGHLDQPRMGATPTNGKTGFFVSGPIRTSIA